MQVYSVFVRDIHPITFGDVAATVGPTIWARVFNSS